MTSTISELPSELTAKEAVQLIASLSDTLSIRHSPPSLRTLRLWRTKGWLSKRSHLLTRRNLLEALGIMRLCADGITTGVAAQRCAGLDDERLAALVLPQENNETSKSREFARVTLELLAQGVIEQHRRVREGRTIGIVRLGQGGAESTPIALRQAMARLGRLYFEDGREDRAASVHELLRQCMSPLSHWAPSALHFLPGLTGSVLIDPDYRVPSEDCEAIGEQAPGTRMEDLIERGLHSRLMSTVERLGSDAADTYTVVREFIARHPLVTEGELRGLTSRPEIPDAAIDFVKSIYIPLHNYHAVNGEFNRCSYCLAPIGRDGRCFLQGCREDHLTARRDQPVRQGDARVAQAEVLKYWVDPARDELRIFDNLRQAGIQAVLYPRLDQCDVAIGDDVGVDVKDYRDPASLARKLNRGVFGLMDWDRRIVAVADRRVRGNTDYIARLRELLLPRVSDELEVLSVRSTLRELKKMYQPSEMDDET